MEIKNHCKAHGVDRCVSCESIATLASQSALRREYEAKMANEVKVFTEDDYDKFMGCRRETFFTIANQLLSQRLVKRFGKPGIFGDVDQQYEGDTHFILSTEARPILKETVKVNDVLSIEVDRECLRAKFISKIQTVRLLGKLWG